ncbi:molybdate ABC transporter permease subunit [uncultured Thiothrix sp.]|uniref:molybdate ABC transporter permease subunit n=1 Tax=uncultured Thiothrix sp. TaxID=223185 RepID=UPI0026278F32|nr:molybdate ABC transporter permease subunit [uncultured Thiothrix sp.]
MLSSEDWIAIALTLKLASLTTLVLLLIATPLAWHLAHTERWWKAPLNALVALPLVLPPTVLGFYLLVVLGPKGWVGQLMQQFGLNTLPFSFSGLLVASVLYSLPFVVQPIQAVFSNFDKRLLEAAMTLRASPLDAFFTIILPLSKHGFLTAIVLGFAHTVGEFGVVLMIGGNITGETRVISVQLYNHVEAMNYQAAHSLAALLVLFSFSVLLGLYYLNRGK